MLDEQVLQEMRDYVDGIDMRPLYDKIRKVTGLKDLEFEKSLTHSRRTGEPIIHIVSDELVDKIGFLKVVFISMKIEEFSSQIKKDSKTGEYYYWMNISFRWQHPGGGSNGKTFLDCVYSDGVWDFRDINY